MFVWIVWQLFKHFVSSEHFVLERSVKLRSLIRCFCL